MTPEMFEHVLSLPVVLWVALRVEWLVRETKEMRRVVRTLERGHMGSAQEHQELQVRLMEVHRART